MKPKPTPSQTSLLDLLNYDPLTGIVVYRESGKEVGSITSDGYLRFKRQGKTWLMHRIIYKMVYGVDCDRIDHENHNRLDNRLENLKNVDDTRNLRNRSMFSNNTSGVVGVSFIVSRQKWQASICHKGVVINLGRFETKAEAISICKQAELDYGYHQNHGESSPTTNES